MLHEPVSEANTPLTPEEQADLIPSLATREELNEWERDNILRARQWALGDRQISRSEPTNEEYIRELHARMFDQTWKWTGTYRKTDKNLGIPIVEIREGLAQLLGNAAYWLKNKALRCGCSTARTSLSAFARERGSHIQQTALWSNKRTKRHRTKIIPRGISAVPCTPRHSLAVRNSHGRKFRRYIQCQCSRHAVHGAKS